MMKAIFLLDNPGRLFDVYGEKQLARLEKLVELDKTAYNSEDVRTGKLSDTEVVFTTWGMSQLSREDIRTYLPKLKAVFYGAGSVQHFARPFLEEGVKVFSAWQANAVPVVQYTFAQIILACKGYFTTQAACRTCRDQAKELHACYPGNYDTKIGILGCGAIGSRICEMLKQLDCEVLVFDPFLSDEKAKALNVKKTTLDEIFATCDVISNHIANLPATVGILKRNHFLSMKPYATFINTGRGPQLDEQDVYDALTQVPTRTALIDVMTHEQDSDNNPLNKLPNCFITPHIAGSSGFEVRRMAEYMMDAFELFEAGKPCNYEVSMKMLETMA